MKAEDFHQKHLRANLNFTKLIEAVYNGDVNELDKGEVMTVAANAAMFITRAMQKFVKHRKLCIVCNTPHEHNNAFCCPEHAEVYKMQQKVKKRQKNG